MAVSAELVKTLRERSGVGIMDCKDALEETKGDIESAIDYLRKKGLSKAVKKADRATSEGLVASYIHAGGKIGVLVYIKRENVPLEVISKEKEIYIHQAKESGKPDNVVQKIAEGKLEKYYTEACLIEQSFVKDPDITIKEFISRKIAELGENIQVSRFVRYQLGKQ